MNPLGNAFEQYGHFGDFRTKFDIREYKELGEKEVNAKVVIDNSPDPALNGNYNNAVDMMNKFAKSERIRQSIIRHAFRYWLGRNETLNDSPTLMAADKAYVENGGSFQEMLVALLSSDSFLYRK